MRRAPAYSPRTAPPSACTWACGEAISYGWFAGDDRVHFFNINGGYDIVVDAKQRRWVPGSRWRYTMEGLTPIFYYTTAGKNFGVFRLTSRTRATS